MFQNKITALLVLVGSQVATGSIHNTFLLLSIVCLCILILKMRYLINAMYFWTKLHVSISQAFPAGKVFVSSTTTVLSVDQQCRAARWCVLVAPWCVLVALWSAATAHMCSEKLTRAWTLTSPVFVELPHQLLPSHIPGWERHPGGSPWFTPFSESAG